MAYTLSRNTENSIFLKIPKFVGTLDTYMYDLMTWLLEHIGPYTTQWRFVYIDGDYGVYIPEDVDKATLLAFKLKFGG